MSNHKVLIQNFSYLSALQAFNMLVPLITYPYLIRVLGKETYGLVVFAQAIIQYLVILVEFGFNISATKEISIHRDNKEKLSEIVSSVIFIKGIFFLVTVVLITIFVLIIPQAKGYEILFFLSMWACLYSVIFPVWYFQGIEKMKYITYITLISRLIFLCLIFVFIHSPKDYYFIPLINGIGALIAGTVSLYIIFNTHAIKFKLQPINIIKSYLTESIPIFISSVSSKIYVQANKVIIGTFLGMTEVAYYDLGEKITTLLKLPQSLLGQALFPKVSKEKDKTFVKRIFKFSIAINIGLFLITVALSKVAVLVLGGEEMLPAIWVINILALSVPIISMSNIFTIQLLIPFGYQRKYSRIIVTSGIVYLFQVGLLLVFSLINIYSLSVVHVTTEIFVATYSYYHCKKLKLWV